MNPPLPTGCHTVKQAAALLGVAEKALFKHLREIGWLHIGTFKNDPAHNRPRYVALTAGFLTTQTRGFPAPYNKKVYLMYSQTLVTQRGMAELGHKGELPLVKPLTRENAAVTQNQPNRVDEEREKAMQQMREWGIAS